MLKNLLCLAALKSNVSAVRSKYVKIAEALHPQLCILLRNNGKAQVVKLGLDFLDGNGLHDVTRSLHVHSLTLIFGKARYKNDVHFLVYLFELFCDRYSVHASHVDV